MVYASPATISRCGVVYVDSNQLGYKPFWHRWLQNRSTTEIKILQVSYCIFSFFPSISGIFVSVYLVFDYRWEFAVAFFFQLISIFISNAFHSIRSRAHNTQMYSISERCILLVNDFRFITFDLFFSGYKTDISKGDRKMQYNKKPASKKRKMIIMGVSSL